LPLSGGSSGASPSSAGTSPSAKAPSSASSARAGSASSSRARSTAWPGARWRWSCSWSSPRSCWASGSRPGCATRSS